VAPQTPQWGQVAAGDLGVMHKQVDAPGNLPKHLRVDVSH